MGSQRWGLGERAEQNTPSPQPPMAPVLRMQVRQEAGISSFADLAAVLTEAPRPLLDSLRQSAVVRHSGRPRGGGGGGGAGCLARQSSGRAGLGWAHEPANILAPGGCMEFPAHPHPGCPTAAPAPWALLCSHAAWGDAERPPEDQCHLGAARHACLLLRPPRLCGRPAVARGVSGSQPAPSCAAVHACHGRRWALGWLATPARWRVPTRPCLRSCRRWRLSFRVGLLRLAAWLAAALQDVAAWVLPPLG
jgi:hypothetical protein